jgi:WD40 repeat protein
MLATGSDDGSIKLWRAADGVLLKEITAFRGLQQIAFSDHGRMIVAFDRQAQLGLWRVDDGSPVHMTTMPRSSAATYTFSLDGQMMAAFDRNALGQGVMLWRVADGRELEWLRLPYTEVASISFSADGKQIAIVDNHGLLILTEVKIKTVNVNG